jgi:hypothetical protein
MRYGDRAEDGCAGTHDVCRAAKCGQWRLLSSIGLTPFFLSRLAACFSFSDFAGAFLALFLLFWLLLMIVLPHVVRDGDRDPPQRFETCALVRPVFKKIQTDKDPFRIRKIPDDVPHRQRRLAHKRRHRDDLMIARFLRMLQQVDHIDLILSLQPIFADVREIGKRSDGFGNLSGDIQLQNPLFRPPGSSLSCCSMCVGFSKLCFHSNNPFAF